MPTNTTITQTFTYVCPDELRSSSVADNTTVNASYTGPSKWWVFVDATTGVIENTYPFYDEANDGENAAAPEGTTKVLVDSQQDPLVASLIDPTAFTMTTAASDVTQTLSNGETWVYSYPLEPDEFVDLDTLTYADGSWTYDMLEPEITWEMLREIRDRMLEATDGNIAEDMPAAVKQPWLDYRAALRDLPATWNGIPAHKVTLPNTPDAGSD